MKVLVFIFFIFLFSCNSNYTVTTKIDVYQELFIKETNNFSRYTDSFYKYLNNNHNKAYLFSDSINMSYYAEKRIYNEMYKK